MLVPIGNRAIVRPRRAEVRWGRAIAGYRVGTITTKAPDEPGRVLVAPTGVDPVTSRFSVVRSTN